MSVVKTTCWDCNKKQKNFCRTHDIKKNTDICKLIQDECYKDAGRKLVGELK